MKFEELIRIYRAAREWLSRTFELPPKTARALLITVALVYILLPNDLIPDWLGILGRIDDLLVFTYIFIRYRRMVEGIRNETRGAGGSTRMSSGGQSSDQTGGGAGEKSDTKREQPRQASDPHTILGVGRGASKDEIREAFRKLAAQYHPDKVSHLGPELRELAHQKMIEIQQAYEKIG